MPLEFISPEGLRLDGRRPGELRKVNCRMGVIEQADGSAYVEMGNTKAMVAVYGPREVVFRARAEHDRAIVNAEFGVASFGTQQRKKSSRMDKRGQEISRIIQNTFASVIQTQTFPRTQIDIFVQVLQSDGGQLGACINATTLALIDAGIPMNDFVCAVHAGCLDGTPLLDLNQLELNGNGPDMPVAIMPRSQKICMAQMDARLRGDLFEKTMRVAMEGCLKLFEIMETAVRKATLTLLQTRGLMPLV